MAAPSAQTHSPRIKSPSRNEKSCDLLDGNPGGLLRRGFPKARSFWEISALQHPPRQTLRQIDLGHHHPFSLRQSRLQNSPGLGLIRQGKIKRHRLHLAPFGMPQHCILDFLRGHMTDGPIHARNLLTDFFPQSGFSVVTHRSENA